MGPIMVCMRFYHARWPVFHLGRRRPMKQCSYSGTLKHREGGARTQKNGIIELNVFFLQDKAFGVWSFMKRALPLFFSKVHGTMRQFSHLCIRILLTARICIASFSTTLGSYCRRRNLRCPRVLGDLDSLPWRFFSCYVAQHSSTTMAIVVDPHYISYVHILAKPR